ncbi:MAG: aconitate hydratase AcnA [Desulfobacterales bacterium]|uniref:Aconitate hydratase n=1 Tax=Candidatus Desulfatibia vada TaxID=2841696 RepID=A0A8J6NTI8_9BACT|nr:aconitate hydratase AcnA [Candidatus Desulfatibia vada]
MERQEYLRQIKVENTKYDILDITLLQQKGIADIDKLPFSIKILVENLLRKLDGHIVKEQDLLNIARWEKQYDEPVEIPYHPARVLMQDFTGVPAVVDLAAMRDAVRELGGDPIKINPLVPVDLIIDHSVQVDYFGTEDALKKNVAKEYERNQERYALLKWAQKSFSNFRVVPPNSGICHQVNLEYLGQVVMTEEIDGRAIAYPDTLVGTDSHTTMIDGIGIMGWGVGGIEAEAVMLGQPYYMSIPEVIGVKMVGELQAGITATDLVLVVTELLRKRNVVEKFVEYFGPGMQNLTIPDRATIANMTPEYGATLGFFPVDAKTVDYLKLTNRGNQANLVEAYTRALGLFYTGHQEPQYTEVLEIDLSTVAPAVAGPARPQDRIELQDLKEKFAAVMGCEYDRDADMADISTFQDESGCMTTRATTCKPIDSSHYNVNLNGQETSIGQGSIVIAAITSCTNTSNPYVLIGAGLLAKKAASRGLKVPSFVKTSLAPGSKVVIRYLKDAGLMPYYETLGFHLAAFGCTTCIGNSGPLHPQIEKTISENDLTVAAVLSGNRNFEARIHQSIKANFLASPMLVVAFALAGRIDIDLTMEPVGLDSVGEPVYLKDLWPTNQEIEHLVQKHVKKEFYKDEYARIFDGDEFWQALDVTESTTFNWDKGSTYIKKPPYFENFSTDLPKSLDVNNAGVLTMLGDSVTTDHISPAGAIPPDYPAGQYLIANNVPPPEFNSYGSRRGNHEVMIRGTFGNIRIKNKLTAPREGSFTIKFPGKKEMFIYDAALEYAGESRPLIVLGGKEYGTGSSRDWAAKGTLLLGVKAVIAESFERIHRSNLVGMGVLPLVFKAGENLESLGLKGFETYYISGIENMQPRKVLQVKAVKEDGETIDFEAVSRLDTDIDVDYFENGGILQYVLRKILS